MNSLVDVESNDDEGPSEAKRRKVDNDNEEEKENGAKKSLITAIPWIRTC